MNKSKAPATQATKRCGFAITIISLILLVNININVIDPLPDAISYLLLARVMLYGAERAPYFAEARDGLIKLGWVNLFKIPAMFVIVGARMNDAFGNDTTAIMAFTFAVLEGMLLIGCVKNLFDAIFRVGERTAASATITPFKLLGITITPEAARLITYIFTLSKCVFSALPTFFLLTRTSEDGFGLTTVSPWYPVASIAVQVIGTVMGVMWFAVMLKYVCRIHKERLFYTALDEIAAADPEGCLDKKRALRNIRFGLTVMTLATALTFDVRFDNTAGINLVPQFLFGLMTVFALIKLRHYISWRKTKPAFICGAVFVNLSFISYVVETFFLYYYGYDDLATKDATVATAFYTAFEAVAAIELIALAIFAVCIGGALKSLTLLNTGIEPCSDKYSLTDRDYHRALSRRINGYTVLCITLGVMKFVNTLSRGITKMVIGGQEAPAYYPLIEWAGTVIAFISILFIGYSLYLFGLIKEEVEMKYSGQ